MTDDPSGKSFKKIYRFFIVRHISIMPGDEATANPSGGGEKNPYRFFTVRHISKVPGDTVLARRSDPGVVRTLIIANDRSLAS
jgi:hypothetical protein